MKIKNFIKDQLNTFPAYTLTEEDQKAIKKEGKASWISQKLMRATFRQGKVDDDTKEFIVKQVEKSLLENKPIYLIPCFGGYKHFWSPSYPEVDWAEFFHLKHMMEYVAPVLAVYEMGVIIEYESEDVAVSRINNYKEESLETYIRSFRKLLNILKPVMPKNLEMRLIRVRDQYPAEKLFKRMGEIFPEKKKEWESLSAEELEMRVHRTGKNILWDGKEDWTKLTEKEKEEKINDTKIMLDTFYDADFELRPDYFEGGNHIPILFSFGLEYENVGNWMMLQSVKGSLVDFWVGRGVIEERLDRILPRILSQNQYNEAKEKLEKERIELIPLKNFSEIEVLRTS